jgi:hypothetical protein
MKRAKIFMGMALTVTALGTFCAWMSGSPSVALVLAVAGGIGSLCTFLGIDNLNESEYRTLPGSTDESGKHRCVYCGHRGVYKHGEYKSNTTWHDCTGCNRTLFLS